MSNGVRHLLIYCINIYQQDIINYQKISPNVEMTKSRKRKSHVERSETSFDLLHNIYQQNIFNYQKISPNVEMTRSRKRKRHVERSETSFD
jgi:hypothetical protein